MHVIFLDASKAFDKLWRNGLFFKLINNVPNDLWRILYKYYGISKANIKKDDKVSSLIVTSEGVKQGGKLSSFLFNYFINDLLKECLDLKIGAEIDGINLSIISYCDDIVIMAPSAGHCQRLIEICGKYAELWKMEFNVKKSAALTIQKSNNKDKSNFFLNKHQIPNVQSVEYLGLPI